MKIIGKRFRRPNIPQPPPLEVDTNIIEAVKPKPTKRALLIGVSAYLPTQEPGKGDGKQRQKPGQIARSGEGVLKGPHKDVAVMKKLLIEKYGYHPNDITTLLDNKDPKQKQPTRENMINEMQNLIKDAVAGDRFFFHYAGHAVQVPNKDNKEEDGMDECLVPCDSTAEENDDKLIKDDVLRSILVEKLPVGCQLVAIFDSCHSASLLDLNHFRCNRVYVPWMSKGRRQSDSMWNATVRRQAALVNTRNIYQTKRMSNTAIKSRKTSQGVLSVEPLPPLPATPASYRTDFDAGSTSSPPSSPAATERGAYFDPDTIERRISKSRRRLSVSTIRSNFNNENWLGGEMVSEICESPVKEFCDGFCRGSSPTTPTARRRSTLGNGMSPISMFRVGEKPAEHGDVISLGSCKDNQLAWEDSTGSSMTQSLVEILSKDPNPTFKDLMLKVSHTMHDRLLQIHQETKAYKKTRKLWRLRKKRKRSTDGDTKGLEMTNFQDPQLSSQKPLDMNKRLSL
ncbi:metacaspase pca1 [Moniliophthora roreri]|uniref:Peptidase C14 caspase domain-containing protein n=1 Tax=Moniliophthora roreri TaxID=221103 RepID=A0A0W0F8R4_MONRR|nr:metacaspase pca1 [Moniliophthora roreri]